MGLVGAEGRSIISSLDLAFTYYATSLPKPHSLEPRQLSSCRVGAKIRPCSPHRHDPFVAIFSAPPQNNYNVPLQNVHNRESDLDDRLIDVFHD
jgi:hypothetical protein